MFLKWFVWFHHGAGGPAFGEGEEEVLVTKAFSGWRFGNMVLTNRRILHLPYASFFGWPKPRTTDVALTSIKSVSWATRRQRLLAPLPLSPVIVVETAAGQQYKFQTDAVEATFKELDRLRDAVAKSR
jgi:hypothetical protein